MYHEHLGKKLTEKYGELSHHLEKIVNEANSEIANLQSKVTSKHSLNSTHHVQGLTTTRDMTIDHDSLQKKNEEISQAYKENSRKLLQIQELYDKLKQKNMLGQVQGAAEDAAASTINGAHGASYDISPLASNHFYEQHREDNPHDPGRTPPWPAHATPPPVLQRKSMAGANSLQGERSSKVSLHKTTSP